MDASSSKVTKNLISLLKHAYETTTYYEKILSEFDCIDHSNVKYIFSKIPILTRQDIQLHRNRLISSQGDTRNWYSMRTSGTTGEPLDFIRDAEFQINEAEVLSDHFDRCLGSKKWRNKNLIHASLNPNLQTRSIPSTWDPSNSALIKWNLTRVMQLDDEDFIKSLQYFNGNIITMFPSAAEIIAKRISEANYAGQIKPYLILLSGETINRSVNSLLQDIFSCPVTEIYTMTEIPIIATECLTDGGYHVETKSVILEIVDNHGIPKKYTDKSTGEIIVTSLVNRAMPLIRYRTGDRGRWITSKCQCCRTSPRIEIMNARQSKLLLNVQNKKVDLLNFVKSLRGLNIDKYYLEQMNDRSINLFYKAQEMMSLRSQNKISALLKQTLGPNIDIGIKRVTTIEAEKQRETSKTLHPISTGYDIGAIISWLEEQLGPHEWIDTALLTGSALTYSTTTKFSDIDLTILVRNNTYLLSWLKLTTHLKKSIPDINCMCNTREGFEIHFPLLTCRLIKEQIILKGNLDLKWPNKKDILSEAKYWLRNTISIIAHRLANTDFTSQNPIHEAWMAMKYALNALRYHYLLQGINETAALKIESLFIVDATYSENLRKDIITLFQVAREQIPPPTQNSENASFFHFSALNCIQQILRILEE